MFVDQGKLNVHGWNFYNTVVLYLKSTIIGFVIVSKKRGKWSKSNEQAADHVRFPIDALVRMKCH